MFTHTPSCDLSTANLWADLRLAALGLTDGDSDEVANMANVAALLFNALPDVNWAGWYRMVAGELVLGPFGGQAACVRIAVGTGVCGRAAATGESQRIADVHAFPGHIACDTASRSELVVPVVREGVVTHVLDLDSPLLDRFTQEDQAGAEALVRALAGRV